MSAEEVKLTHENDPDAPFRQRVLAISEPRPERGSQIEMLLKMKEEIQSGKLKEEDFIGECHILMRNIGDKALILSVLGPDTLMKYFKSLSGLGRLYEFAFPMDPSDLLIYLNYELEQESGLFVLNIIKERPVSKAGINIFVSHCIQSYMFTLTAAERGGELDLFLAEAIAKYPSTKEIFSKVFNVERMKLAEKLASYPMGTAPWELIEKQQKLDESFFQTQVETQAANDDKYGKLARAA